MDKWTNLTEEEAQEGYDEARSRYNSAAEEYFRSRNAYEDERTELRTVQDKCDSARSDKLDFEKRIEAIGQIIAMLEENGSVNEAVNEVNVTAAAAEILLSQSVVCSGVNSPSLSTAFRSKKVAEETNSAEALRKFKAEKARLERALEDVDRQINNLEQAASEQISKMNALLRGQTDLRRVMNASSFEMCHYRKYTG